MNTRAAQALEEFTSFSLLDYYPGGLEKWIDFHSLVRVIEHLLDNGASLTLADTIAALEHRDQIHCRAVSQAAQKRGITFSVDRNGLTVVDHLLRESGNLDESLETEIIDLFIEHGSADAHQLSKWLLRAARDSTPNVVACLIEHGADPLARNSEGGNAIGVARRRLELLRGIITNPLREDTTARELYEERFNSTSILQYLEPDYVQPDVPAVHMESCDGCDMASWSFNQVLLKLTIVVAHNRCALQV
jgi:hypothetical protein